MQQLPFSASEQALKLEAAQQYQEELLTVPNEPCEWSHCDVRNKNKNKQVDQCREHIQALSENLSTLDRMTSCAVSNKWFLCRWLFLHFPVYK